MNSYQWKTKTEDKLFPAKIAFCLWEMPGSWTGKKDFFPAQQALLHLAKAGDDFNVLQAQYLDACELHEACITSEMSTKM